MTSNSANDIERRSLLPAIPLLAHWLLPAMATSDSHFNITTVPGYFYQDEPDTDPSQFDYVSSNFGLIPRSYDTDTDPELAEKNTTQWQRFYHHINRLNEDCRRNNPDASYRLLVLGRHGEGWHNVAEEKYGTEMWDCYYSLQNGDDTMTWLDAQLTPKGENQAQTARAAWETQLKTHIPTPQSFYVSPLRRCLQTADITFRGVKGMPLTEPFRPVVKELLRETIGLHTCDKRSPLSSIESDYPNYRIEPGFTQNDTLWKPDERESTSACDARLLTLLQDIFAHDANTVLSLTAHSQAIAAVLNVTGHRRFAVLTGAVIPVFVRVEKVAGKLPERVVEPPTGKPGCPAGRHGTNSVQYSLSQRD